MFWITPLVQSPQSIGFSRHKGQHLHINGHPDISEIAKKRHWCCGAFFVIHKYFFTHWFVCYMAVTLKCNQGRLLRILFMVMSMACLKRSGCILFFVHPTANTMVQMILKYYGCQRYIPVDVSESYNDISPAIDHDSTIWLSWCIWSTVIQYNILIYFAPFTRQAINLYPL